MRKFCTSILPRGSTAKAELPRIIIYALMPHGVEMMLAVIIDSYGQTAASAGTWRDELAAQAAAADYPDAMPFQVAPDRLIPDR